jgi:hypothetical protein
MGLAARSIVENVARGILLNGPKLSFFSPKGWDTQAQGRANGLPHEWWARRIPNQLLAASNVSGLT